MKKHLLIFGISILLIHAALSGCIEQIGSGDIVSVGGIYGSGFPNYLDGVQELKIHGDYLYVSAYLDCRVTILSVEDNKSNPVFVSSIHVGAVPRKLSISDDGNWLYLGTERSKNYGSGNLTIINITDKANPTIESELIIDSDGHIIGSSYVESKEICYVISFSENKLYSINVSDKTKPKIISYVKVGNHPHGIWANETIAFVLGHSDRTVYTFDVSDASNMTYLDGYTSTSLHRCSQLCGEYAPIMYVASLNHSISIFDISNSSDIQRIKEIDFGEIYVCSVVPNAEETVMYVTRAHPNKYPGMLYSYNITDKSNPILIAIVRDSSSVPLGRPTAGALGVIGNYIYVGLWDDDGISVFENDKILSRKPRESQLPPVKTSGLKSGD